MSRVQIGRLDLWEAFVAEAQAGFLNLRGQESSPPLTRQQAYNVHEAMRSMNGQIVAVRFDDKDFLNGFYRVEELDTMIDAYPGVFKFSWTLGLHRLGSDGHSEIESQLVGGERLTDHGSLTPVKWHAPSMNHHSYYTLSTTPSSFTRTSADGEMTIYTGVPDFNPRWGTSASDYHEGEVTLRADSQVVPGLDYHNHPEEFELSNSLARISPNGTNPGRFDIAFYDGSAWRSRVWQVMVGGSALNTAWDAMSILKNEPEEVVVRLVRSVGGGGRISLDINLRRGSRFVGFFLQRHAAATLGVRLSTAVAGTSFTGGVRASSNDANGNRYVVGSAVSHTADIGNGGLSKASVSKLDFFIGMVVGGSSAQSGDTHEDLMAQYLGTPAETTLVVRR